ncbi:MAG: response regulator transcription factor [Nitrospirae bacterium]|nr:response regulator transcription factor [Nitrospirota bacterium]
MIRAILVDDHKMFREGLKEMLRATGDIVVVGEADNGKSAHDLVQRLRPDAVILDVSLPDMDGLDVARGFEGTPSRVVLLTMHDDPVTLARAARARLPGFVLKDSAFEDLVQAIRTVAAGGRFVSASVAAKLDALVFDGRAPGDSLTDREREILQWIARGLTNRQIGKKLSISTKTVETHRTHIMDKLDLHKAADLVRYAMETGLV